MRGVSVSETTRPAHAPMNLDVGRPVARDVVRLAALSFGFLSLGTLGGFIFWGATPAGVYSPWSGWRVLLLLFGGSVALVGFGLGVNLARLMVHDWKSYHRRLDDWHYAALEAYEQAQGQETHVQTSAWELTTSAPRDMLLVALALHYEVQKGNTSAHTVRALTGDKWLGGIRLGDINTTQAQRMSKALVDMRLVKGKEGRSAGTWTPESPEQVIELVMNNWSRVRETTDTRGEA